MRLPPPFPFQLLYLLMFSVQYLPLSPAAGGLCRVGRPRNKTKHRLPVGDRRGAAWLVLSKWLQVCSV